MSDILIGHNDSTETCLEPRYGNRHGKVAGATGTFKSVSPMLLAEGLSRLGAPCVVTDVKGDLACLAMPGKRARRQAQGAAVKTPSRRLTAAGQPDDPGPVRRARPQIGRQILRSVLCGVFGGRR
ncbi:MAG TPA: helicase HerA-like domain-containing protein [Frateuria sp.]|uniref:helicase HerA-like domain-containing protein n=1 Tax=Frateuria sp. TaxID=2211372 RepID=UPI002DF11A04|nr:helicase HerA-like domain-containing protein [Frateuria sp.]